jgi:hypothetical protein
MLGRVLAHMGGIDEIGIFLVPAVLAIIVLRRVERKARQKESEEQPVIGPESP